eukprot:9495913-Pyramimonas_sp.AAC.1
MASSGAAAAGVQNKFGKSSGEHARRLTLKVNEVKQALSPESKRRVEAETQMDESSGLLAAQFAPAPAFPGSQSSAVPPSTPAGVAPPDPPPSAAILVGAPAPASGSQSGACPGAGFVPLAHAAASGAPTAPGA